MRNQSCSVCCLLSFFPIFIWFNQIWIQFQNGHQSAIFFSEIIFPASSRAYTPLMLSSEWVRQAVSQWVRICLWRRFRKNYYTYPFQTFTHHLDGYIQDWLDLQFPQIQYGRPAAILLKIMFSNITHQLLQIA
jgi:zinc transporter ZupT